MKNSRQTSPMQLMLESSLRAQQIRRSFVRDLDMRATVFFSNLIYTREEAIANLDATSWLSPKILTIYMARLANELIEMGRLSRLTEWKKFPCIFFQPSQPRDDAIAWRLILERTTSEVDRLLPAESCYTLPFWNWSTDETLEGGRLSPLHPLKGGETPITLGFPVPNYSELLGVRGEVATMYFLRIVAQSIAEAMDLREPNETLNDFHRRVLGALRVNGHQFMDWKDFPVSPAIKGKNPLSPWELIVLQECTDPSFCITAKECGAAVRRACPELTPLQGAILDHFQKLPT